ncbi:serine/threonine protein kinase [Candidatus Uabimicrobium amorphum]|uniref:non-specific serine/threonine protein kinase n=1 Tax=Uabimicrobium amorphum TaxID=2596890 RepID=A0A5S9F409_UABAM|nr:serine/threonine-protein kinase [Candidatus Uabimicrobium amorphum]BBM83974.1 serine/threonine protein kinase [Candidatus Uabimicrobium amorphum]
MKIDGFCYSSVDFHKDDLLLIKICLEHDFVPSKELQRMLASSPDKQLIFQLTNYLDEKKLSQLIKLHNSKILCQCGALLTKGITKCDQCNERVSDRRGRSTRKHKRYGKYKPVEKVGEGSVGVVYKAIQTDLDRTVALKVLQADVDDTAFLRFKQESQAVASLNHPSIVSLHDVGQANNEYFLAMEFVDGKPLTNYIRKRKLTIEDSVKIIIQIIRGLQHAHQKKIIHRDIKPDNIIITNDKVPKITDFGLARRLNQKSRITQNDIIMGTPIYMSPEQARGEHNLEYSTDIYSTGVVFYEMLSGQLPFNNDSTTLVLLHRIIKDPPPALHRVDPSIPPALNDICMKALEKDPKDRYKTMKHFADKVEQFFEDNYVKKEVPIVEDISTDELEIENASKKRTLRTLISKEDRLEWYDIVLWVLLGFGLVYFCHKAF